jgi:hypothetical protein
MTERERTTEMNHIQRLLRTAAILALVVAAVGSLQAAEPVRERVLSSWDEDVTVGERTVKGRVDVVFDYRQGLAFRQVYDDQGQLVESRPASRIATPSAEEIDAAIQIVEADPRMGQIIRDLQAYVDGGFIFHEEKGKPCGPRSRCLQIFAFSIGSGGAPLFRAVVDLTKNEIVYSDRWRQGVSE